ncbi:MAG: hypothetical protein V3T77_11490 [Planctomycetota bacterium]
MRIKEPARLALVGLLSCFACFYLWYLAPVLQWGDPSKLLMAVRYEHVNVASGSGHGLLILTIQALDWILPGNYEVAARFASPIFTLLALAIFWRTLGNAGVGIRGRAMAVTALGVSHLFWTVSEIVESYSLVALCFAAWLWAAQRYPARPNLGRCVTLLLINGIGILNHQILLLTLPVQFIYFSCTLEARARRDWIGLHLAGTLLAAVTLWFYPALWVEAWQSAVSSTERWVLPSIGIKLIWIFPLLLLIQFPGIAFLSGAYGVKKMFQNSPGEISLLLIITMLVVAFFSLSYGIGRGVYLLLPAYMCFAFLVGSGWEKWSPGKRLSTPTFGLALVLVFMIPVAGYAAAWRTCDALGIYPVSKRSIAYRAPNRYYLWPGKHGDDGANRFCREVALIAGPGTLVLADFRIAMTLKYSRARGGYDYQIFDTDLCAFLPEDQIRKKLYGIIDSAHEQGQGVLLADRKSVDFYTRNRILLDLLPEMQEKYQIEKIGNFHTIRPGSEFKPAAFHPKQPTPPRKP